MCSCIHYIKQNFAILLKKIKSNYFDNELSWLWFIVLNANFNNISVISELFWIIRFKSMVCSFIL